MAALAIEQRGQSATFNRGESLATGGRKMAAGMPLILWIAVVVVGLVVVAASGV